MSITRMCPIALAVAAFVVVPTASAAAPPNDDIAAATAITALPFSDTVGVGEATLAGADPQYCAYSYQTVWYSFTPAADMTVEADSSGSSFPANLTVFQQAGGLSYVGCGSYGSSITFAVRAGQTYYIEAGNPYGNGGTLQMSLQAIPPPANDAFENAAAIGATPFSASVDLTAATMEPGEPAPSCGYGPPQKTVWYAFTAPASGSYTAAAPSGVATQLALYDGTSLASLAQLACRAFQPLTFHADAGTTYYLQVGTFAGNNGPATVTFGVTPPPVAQFWASPFDPSVIDTVQFYDQSSDPGGAGFADWTWSFGDGATATGQYVQHRYAADGDYTVSHTVTTTDGRTATSTLVVHVRTHDVQISKLTVPTAASVGQTRSIAVSVADTHYAETVQVQLLRSTPSGWATVGTLTQSIPAGKIGHGTDYAFSYTFTADDASMGKVSFRAIATIQGARDAYPADNDVTSLPTKVK